MLQKEQLIFTIMFFLRIDNLIQNKIRYIYFFFIVFVIGLCPDLLNSEDLIAGTKDNAYLVWLNVDRLKKAKASYKGILTLLSIGEKFEYYKRDLNGSRERNFIGPSRGKLPGNLEEIKK